MAKAKKNIKISVRVSPEMVKRAEALINSVADDGEQSGFNRIATTSDVYREALLRGLKVLEREAQREGT